MLKTLQKSVEEEESVWKTQIMESEEKLRMVGLFTVLTHTHINLQTPCKYHNKEEEFTHFSLIIENNHVMMWKTFIIFQGEFGGSFHLQVTDAAICHLECFNLLFYFFHLSFYVGTQKGAGIRRDNRELEREPENPTGTDFTCGNEFLYSRTL